MTTADAVATIRPRPSGPPLRGRATLRNGITNWRRKGRCQHETRTRRFHLNVTVSWSKIGGRRTKPAAFNAPKLGGVRPLLFASAAVLAGRRSPFEFVLRTCSGNGGEPLAHASHR